MEGNEIPDPVLKSSQTHEDYECNTMVQIWRAHTDTHKGHPHPRLIPIMSLLIRVLGEQSCQRNPITSQMMESFTVDEDGR